MSVSVLVLVAVSTPILVPYIAIVSALNPDALFLPVLVLNAVSTSVFLPEVLSTTVLVPHALSTFILVLDYLKKKKIRDALSE